MAKLLALPVFCGVILIITLISYGLPAFGLPVLRTILALKLILLIIGAGLAIHLGPFANGEGWAPFIAGMTLISAMAIQNAAHRIYLGSEQPSTQMTGTTTQITIDLDDMLHGLSSERRPETHKRIQKMLIAIGRFAAGCCAAALSYNLVETWCFLVPPALAFLTFIAATEAKSDVPAS